MLNKMELKEFQKQAKELIAKIDSKQKGKHDAETTLIHLTEELGELARQIYNKKVGRDTVDKSNIEEEISECLILLAQLANNFDIDLEKSVKETIKKLEERFKV
jgi:NTP pyrophosphatase (non-canonical NTP hydrolase)